MIRFALLGSGSRGNATLIEGGRTRLLVDCGFSLRETEQRLARLGVSPESLSAVLVTHEHGDHLRGVLPLARRYRLAVWMTPGTGYACRLRREDEVRPIRLDEPFTVGDLRITPFAVPHDAREPCQFRVDDGDLALGLLTDAGCLTPHVRKMLDGCHGLVLECNHDPGMLAAGPYPPALKRRVGGDYGHLSNGQAASLLTDIATGRLQCLVGAHLSEKNNRPELAARALAGALGCRAEEIEVAAQDVPSRWFAMRRAGLA
ncbi:MAG: MBL fold metallo-hydrolase [Gammaproteobacteria bacterium]|nr:MAG: MBL fold metallo-hydrolase [Gammaproteobacteria bacterium]